MSGIKISSLSAPRSLIPPWLKGKWGILGIISIFYILLNLLWTYFHWGGSQHVTLITNLVSFPPSLLASVIAWRTAAQPSLSRAVRRAWFLLGMSFLMFLIGNIVWAYLEVVLQVEPFPSLADVFYLAFYPIALWGLLTLPSAQQDSRQRLAFWLDLLSVFIAATMFVGYFIIVPTAATSSNDLLTQLIASAYPIGSLFLTAGLLSILYRRPSADTQSALNLLLVGMVFFLVGDFAFSYTSLNGTYMAGGWTDASWNVAQLFFALAALRQMHAEPSHASLFQSMRIRQRLAKRLPFLAVALAYGLAVYVAIANFSEAAEWLFIAAVILTVLIITRQIFGPSFLVASLRTKLILTFFLVCALSIGLVAFFTFLTLRSNLQSVLGSNLQSQAQVHAQAVGSLVSKQSDVLEGFVLNEPLQDAAATASARYSADLATIQAALQQQDLAWKSAEENDPLVQSVLNSEMALTLHQFLDNFPAFADVLLTDKYGATIAASTRPEGYYQAEQDWWQGAYHRGEGLIYYSQPFKDPVEPEQLSILIAIPVRAHIGSELVGIIRVTYDLQDVLETLAATNPELTADFHLLLPNGQLLLPDGEFLSLDADTLERLHASANANYAELNFEGKPQYVSQGLVTIPDPEEALTFKNLNWTLIAHQDTLAALSPVNAARRTALLVAIIVLFLTSAIAILLADLFVAPVSRLTAVATQIAAGDLSAKAQVESQDEIGTLAGTFNRMLATLSQTQQELQESETLYRSLVDYSPDMILVYSNGRCLFINPAGAKMLGAESVDQLIGRPILDLIPPEDWEHEEKDIEQTQALWESTQLLQRKPRRLDGTSFDAEFKAIPISYAGQSAMQLVLRDITERKQAEEKIRDLLTEVARQRGDLEIRVEQRTAELNMLNRRLQDELAERQRLVQSLSESESRFHLLFEASPDAILLVDPYDPATSWPILDCNEAACMMNGYRREELIGQSIDILNTTPGTSAERANYLDRIRQQGVLHQEVLHRHKAGHLFPVEISSSLITVKGRELVLGIDRDITERKQVEAALKQTKELAEEANRAKSEFLSRMSHELRTPMNAILGFAQLLTMSHKDPLTPTQKERVRQIVKGGQHLLDLINEILDISRIEAGRLQISPEPVSIRESIQEVLDLTMPLAADRHIQLHANLEMEANPYVMADRQRLKQILLNLLSNAVKYNYDGGSVMISHEKTSADRWRISVTDTGSGIAPENIGRLFTPFERLVADTSNVEGTGLGLALARRLVELMRGDIGVESTPGRGSTFWVELPAAESQLARLQRTGSTAELPAISAVAGTILYVEDNVANFELIQQILVDYEQIELLWATDPEQGMKLAYQHRPSLILLDLHLGGRDGGEILKLLNQDTYTSSIPVVIVSADATHGQVQRLLAMGATAYLTKPLDVKRFVQLIEELLNAEQG